MSKLRLLFEELIVRFVWNKIKNIIINEDKMWYWIVAVVSFLFGVVSGMLMEYFRCI
jgi:hypothetical protein